MSGAPVVRLAGVSKIYRGRGGEVEALRGVDLEIHRGEILTILGPSGCGKSTLLSLVAGFERPSGGEILLERHPVAGVEPRCAMIFQSYALFPWLSVLENVAFGPRVRGVPARARREAAAAWLARVGLSDFAEAYPGELSGGMRQRVALCRALANDPKVLLCDEPFAALDALTRERMQGELLRIAAEAGQTVLFITHAIDEALILSDRIAVMTARPGRIRSVHENALPRPRRAEVQLTPEYLAMKRRLWDEVREEAGR